MHFLAFFATNKLPCRRKIRMRRIIYIINPISGTRTKKDLQAFIEKETKAKGIPFDIYPSVASGDYSFLLPAIKANKITDIVIAGGDGTVSQVVGSLMDCPVNFGIIPCGSGNGLAYAAGISKIPSKALETVFNGKAVAIDGFTINDRFACMLTGLGFDAQVAHEFAQQPKRGLKTYASLVSKNFFRADPYTFEIESNGLKFSTEAYFISIANSNQFGNNFTIAPKAILSDGLLDIVIAKKTVKPLLLFNLLRQILTGKVSRIENSLSHPVIYFQTEKVIIDNKSEAPIHIDGDPAETPAKVVAEIKKECFRLIHP
jgi:diacylglycerol kinase (ATP)